MQLFDVAPDAGGTRDDAHAGRYVQLVHGFAQFLAVFTLDTARNTAAAWIIGHKNQVAASQRDEGGKGGAFIAALFLFDLNDQFLAFSQGVLDTRCAYVDPFLEIRSRHFLERKETMALFAVADKAGFKARFDSGDHAFVDVAFALFAPGGFYVQINEFLTIDYRNA